MICHVTLSFEEHTILQTASETTKNYQESSKKSGSNAGPFRTKENAGHVPDAIHTEWPYPTPNPTTSAPAARQFSHRT